MGSKFDDIGKTVQAISNTFSFPIFMFPLVYFCKIPKKIKKETYQRIWYGMSQIPITDLYNCWKGDEKVNDKYDKLVQQYLDDNKQK